MSCPCSSRSTSAGSGYVLCSTWNRTARIRMRGALPWMLSVVRRDAYQKQILNCSCYNLGLRVVYWCGTPDKTGHRAHPPGVFPCSQEVRQRFAPSNCLYILREFALCTRCCTRGLTSASSALASSTANIFGPIAPRPAATSTDMMKVGRIPVLRNSAAFLINEFDTEGGAEERGKAKAELKSKSFHRFDAGDVGCERHS